MFFVYNILNKPDSEKLSVRTKLGVIGLNFIKRYCVEILDQ